MDSLPDVVEADIGALCRKVSERGYVVTVLNEGPMHSYQVIFEGPKALTITADRGQLFVSGERAELEPADLWKAYDSREEFAAAVLAYLRVG